MLCAGGGTVWGCQVGAMGEVCRTHGWGARLRWVGVQVGKGVSQHQVGVQVP